VTGLLATVRADVEATTHPNFRLRGDFWVRAVGKLLLAPNVRAVVWFRVAHALAGARLLPLALLVRARILRIAGADIHPLASIGPGLYLVHSSGVVIGPDVVIGARCRMHHGVTLGGSVHLADAPSPAWAGPTLGDDVVLGAHAVLLGAVRVGSRATVGANAVVVDDVPDGATVAGVPAREVDPSRRV